MPDQEKRSKYSYEELKRKYIDKEPAKQTTTKEVTNALSIFIGFIFNMVLLIAAGLFIGYFIDKRLETTPIFMLLLTLLGIGAAFRNLIKSISAINRNKGSS